MSHLRVGVKTMSHLRAGVKTMSHLRVGVKTMSLKTMSHLRVGAKTVSHLRVGVKTMSHLRADDALAVGIDDWDNDMLLLELLVLDVSFTLPIHNHTSSLSQYSWTETHAIHLYYTRTTPAVLMYHTCILLLLLVWVSWTITGQPRNNIFIHRV